MFTRVEIVVSAKCTRVGEKTIVLKLFNYIWTTRFNAECDSTIRFG